jgi:hypothetical protein
MPVLAYIQIRVRADTYDDSFSVQHDDKKEVTALSTATALVHGLLL